jgi:hypothetical protein
MDVEDLVRRVRREELWTRVADAILATPGELPEPTRRAIAAGDGPPELAPLLEKVRREAHLVTDADVAALGADAVIEATLAASLGVALEQRREALEAIG